MARQLRHLFDAHTSQKAPLSTIGTIGCTATATTSKGSSKGTAGSRAAVNLLEKARKPRIYMEPANGLEPLTY